jgi:hypothetical protein
MRVAEALPPPGTKQKIMKPDSNLGEPKIL